MSTASAPPLHRHESTPPPRARPAAPRRGGWGFATFFFLLLLLGAGAGALFYYLVHQPLAADASRTRSEVQTLERELGAAQARLERAEAERAAAVAEAERLRGEHGQLARAVEERETQIAELEAAQRTLQEQLGAEIASGDVHITGGGGELSVGLADQILFPPGEAALSDRGKTLLRRVAESLAELDQRVIQVGGHTDAMPPSRQLQERFPSNWELSTARATNVVRFLTEECGIPGERLVASGFSQYRPASSNRSAAGRRRNRRIELTLASPTERAGPSNDP